MGAKKKVKHQIATIYRRFPKELFRINSGGPIVQVRPKRTYDPQSINAYDIITTGLKPGVPPPKDVSFDGILKAARVVDKLPPQLQPKSGRDGGHFDDLRWSSSSVEDGYREGDDGLSSGAFKSMWAEAAEEAEVEEPKYPAPVMEASELLKEHVVPRSMKPKDYTGPNGLRLRLNTPFTQHYFRRMYKGYQPIILAVQAGTMVPNDLVLVRLHQSSEEWCLEPARKMTLQELNDKINRFLSTNAAKLTRQQWGNAYLRATEPTKPVPVPKKFKVPSHDWLLDKVRNAAANYRR